MSKLYSHIGVATYRGKTKFRWTMGQVELRIKTMTKGGLENIEFQALSEPMTKADALKTQVAVDLAARYGLVLSLDTDEPANTDTVEDQVAA